MAKIDQPLFSILQNKTTHSCKAATNGCITQLLVVFC